MRLLKAITVGLMLSAPAGVVQARELLCQYDHITHLNVLRISENPNSGDLNVTSHNEVSPVGQSNMYLFKVSPTPEKRTDMLRISGRLFGDDVSPTQLAFIDFEKAIFRALQFPETSLEQATDILTAPLAVWDCHRTD